jgi:hypothetical protein
MSYTYAVLEVSPETYREIRKKLDDAGYAHAFHHDRTSKDGQELIDMHGIALKEEETPRPVTAELRSGNTQ